MKVSSCTGFSSTVTTPLRGQRAPFGRAQQLSDLGLVEVADDRLDEGLLVSREL
jgi:hypothetical protein